MPNGSPPPNSRKGECLEIIRELYPQGIPIPEIAKETGVAITTLYDWLRELGIPRNSRRMYVTDGLRERIRRKLTIDADGSLQDEAVRLYEEELLATTEIGKRFGVSAVTVGQWLERSGVPRRSRPTVCVREKLRQANLGSKRYNWKGGISAEQVRTRTSLSMRLARQACFERDDYICQSCGLRGGCLNAHHVWPFQRFPNLRFEINNLITLCRECHDRFHKMAGGHVKIAIGPFFYNGDDPRITYG